MDDLIPAWEQHDGESSLWFDRLYKFYLPLGPSRSINAAYRCFREQAQPGLNPATQLRAPGPWRDAATKNDWAARARSWDEEQRRIERQAHLDAVKKANERHQLIVRSRTNALLRVMSSPAREEKWMQMSVSEERQWMLTLIQTDRLLLSQPISIQEERLAPVDEAASQAGQATPPDIAIERFQAAPEMIAAVIANMAIYEHKPDPEEPPAEPEPSAVEPPAVEPPAVEQVCPDAERPAQ